MTRAEMEQVLANGGSLLYDGRLILETRHLPSEQELADYVERLRREAVENEAKRRADGWTPPEECDCRRLTRPLAEKENLPNHVCMHSAHVSCVNWANEYREARGGDAPLVIAFGDRFIHADSPEDWPFLFADDRKSPVGPLDLNRAGRIYLVLRQWVEDADEDLAKQLDSNADICREIEAFARKQEYIREIKTDVRLQYSGEIVPENGPACYVSPEYVEYFRAQKLPAWKVPCTPGTARYLLWKICGLYDTPEPPSLPTRGALVTSLLVTPTSDGFPSRDPERGDVLFQISGSSLWDAPTTLETASRIVRQHREFLQKTPYWLPKFKSRGSGNKRGPKRKHDAVNADIEHCISRGAGLTEALDYVWQEEAARFAKTYSECQDAPQTKRNHEKAVKQRVRDRYAASRKSPDNVSA